MKTKKAGMTAKQARMIRTKLIPFIKREQGRGFAMETMLEKWFPGEFKLFDDIPREVPVCGTVACIAGSVVALHPPKKKDPPRGTAERARRLLGLTHQQADALFCGWEGDNHYFDGEYTEDDDESDYCLNPWPKKFMREYRRAKTTRGKASVACRLLELVAATRGACLNRTRKARTK